MNVHADEVGMNKKVTTAERSEKEKIWRWTVTTSKSGITAIDERREYNDSSWIDDLTKNMLKSVVVFNQNVSFDGAAIERIGKYNFRSIKKFSCSEYNACGVRVWMKPGKFSKTASFSTCDVQEAVTKINGELQATDRQSGHAISLTKLDTQSPCQLLFLWVPVTKVQEWFKERKNTSFYSECLKNIFCEARKVDLVGVVGDLMTVVKPMNLPVDLLAVEMDGGAGVINEIAVPEAQDRLQPGIIEHLATKETEGAQVSDAKLSSPSAHYESQHTPSDRNYLIVARSDDECSSQASSSRFVPVASSLFVTIDSHKRRSAYSHALTILHALSYVTPFIEQLDSFTLDDTPFSVILQNLVAVNRRQPAEDFESLLRDWNEVDKTIEGFDGKEYRDVADFLQVFQTALYKKNVAWHNAVSTIFRSSAQCPKCLGIIEMSRKILHIEMLRESKSINGALLTIPQDALICCGEEISKADYQKNTEWGPVLISTINVVSSSRKFVDMILNRYDLVAVVSHIIDATVSDEASSRHYAVSIKSENDWTFYIDDSSYDVPSYADDEDITKPAVVEKRSFIYERRTTVSQNLRPCHSSRPNQSNERCTDSVSLDGEIPTEPKYKITSDNKYECKVCGKTYKHGYNVNKHWRQKHGINE